MNVIRVGSKADLLARTLAMLSETVERYDLFADQMEVVNNPVAEEIFKWLSQKQSERTEVVEQLANGMALPHIPPWDYDWDDAINTSVPGWTSAHYMMTPYHTLSLAMDFPFKIHTPLMHLTKADSVKLMEKLGRLDLLKYTHTCYEGCVPACGKCPACKLRLKGFKEAGVKDPIPYC